VDLKFFSLIVGLILVSGLFSSPMAFGFIGASEGPGIPTITSDFDDDDDGDEDGNFIRSVTIKYCPECGPWIKIFNTGFVSTTNSFYLEETINVELNDPGTVPISDWHEIMVPTNPTAPDAIWGTSCTAPDGSTFSPNVMTPDGIFPPSMLSPLGIWFDFPPVPPGSSFTVFKCFELITNFPIEVHEWPTVPPRTAVGGEFIPIDATAVLIAGMQTNALSVLGAFVVIGAISFGALYISVKRKRN